MKNFIFKLLFLFSYREKIQALGLLVLMLFGAILEAIGIALIFPLIALINDSAVLQKYQTLKQVYDYSGSTSLSNFSFRMIVALLGIYLFKYVYLGILYHLQYRFITNRQISLSMRLFKAYLHSPYPFHLQRNSAKLLTNVNSTVHWIFTGVIVPTFGSLVEVMVVGTVLFVLLFISLIPTLGAIVILGGAGATFYYFTKQRSTMYGKIQEERYAEMTKWVNQGLGGVKEVKVLGREDFFLQSYFKNSIYYGRATRFIRAVGDLSRLFIEALVICSVLLLIAVMLWLGQDMQSLVPVLGLFAVAAIRLMPSANRILYSLSTIRFHTVFVDEIYQDLKDLEESFRDDHLSETIDGESDKKLFFDKTIKLENISFRYAGTEKDTLKNITLSIPKGNSVAFVGSSGAGKTTIVDVILGLLQPTNGRILLDDIDIKTNLNDWQRKIGYIPQPIYLSDDTIVRNVAFGVNDEDIDEDQVWKSLRAAQLEDFVVTLPNKLETNVGENGVCLSGGQRQRIGIARALYHDPEVLVLDEATAALDNKTESEVTKAIEALSGTKTVIVIAHRLTTVRNFDCIFFMKNGEIMDAADFDYLLKNNAEFQLMANHNAPSNEVATVGQ